MRKWPSFSELFVCVDLCVSIPHIIHADMHPRELYIDSRTIFVIKLDDVIPPLQLILNDSV